MTLRHLGHHAPLFIELATGHVLQSASGSETEKASVTRRSTLAQGNMKQMVIS
jgi:hypothetical protein